MLAHYQRRLELGVDSEFKLARQRANGTRSGLWRGWMREDFLNRKSYSWGNRGNHLEGLETDEWEALTSLKPIQLPAQAAIKLLAYTLRR
jgi:hypothetical protein